ncbi:hypothetical protein HAX54_012046 [Datura stramonium]|uniref:Uncharacterized protein n=1 Tax=Datura stramonium TaxID=4076 RepID=A0ABS8TJ61_DATST|nr:hypothetical protein [Datura stramonium]
MVSCQHHMNPTSQEAWGPKFENDPVQCFPFREITFNPQSKIMIDACTLRTRGLPPGSLEFSHETMMAGEMRKCSFNKSIKVVVAAVSSKDGHNTPERERNWAKCQAYLEKSPEEQIKRRRYQLLHKGIMGVPWFFALHLNRWKDAYRPSVSGRM